MRIAIPLVNGKLSQHFGHLDHVALVDVDTAEKKIIQQEEIEAPPLQPGLLSSWLAERGTNMIIAGGMGQRAQGMFAEHGIEVLISWPKPMHHHDALNLRHFKLPMTEQISKEVVSLPLFPELSNEQIEFVIESVRKFYGK